MNLATSWLKLSKLFNPLLKSFDDCVWVGNKAMNVVGVWDETLELKFGQWGGGIQRDVSTCFFI
jgi:hypothetical protein